MGDQRQTAPGRARQFGRAGALGLAVTVAVCAAVLPVISTVPPEPIDDDQIPGIQLDSSALADVTTLPGPDGLARIWPGDGDRGPRASGGRGVSRRGAGAPTASRGKTRNGLTADNGPGPRSGEGRRGPTGRGKVLGVRAPGGPAPGTRSGGGDRARSRSQPTAGPPPSGDSPSRTVTAPTQAAPPAAAASDPPDVDSDPDSQTDTDPPDPPDNDADAPAPSGRGAEPDDPPDPDGE